MFIRSHDPFDNCLHHNGIFYVKITDVKNGNFMDVEFVNPPALSRRGSWDVRLSASNSKEMVFCYRASHNSRHVKIVAPGPGECAGY